MAFIVCMGSTPVLVASFIYLAIQDTLHKADPRYQLDQKSYELCMASLP